MLNSLPARRAALDASYGTTKAAHMPASHTLHLFAGDPSVDGVELSNVTEVDDGLGGTTLVPNGYAPPTVPNDATWLPATADGMKSTAAPIQFPDVTCDEGYGQTVTHALLRDPDGNDWDSFPLAQPLDVTAAGPGPKLTPTVFYGDDVQTED